MHVSVYSVNIIQFSHYLYTHVMVLTLNLDKSSVK